MPVSHVIVTGANGYLGSYICRELIGRGIPVIGFKYDHYAPVTIDHPLIEYVHCDIREPVLPQLRHFLNGKKAGALINAAALLGSSDYDRNYAVNARGVENLLEFARETGIRRFIQISSVVVIKEFKGPYGETKLIGQEMVEQSGMDYTVFIPAMILGPEGLGINRILKNVFRFPFIVPLIGSGRQTQHPIYVRDFAKYIVDSVTNPACSGKIYQIAGNEVISFRDFIRLILKIRGSRKIFIPVPAWFARMLGRLFQKTQKVPLFTAEHVKGVLQDSRLDTTLIRKDLDFQPAPLTESMKHCLDVIGDNWDYYLKPRGEKSLKP